MTSTATNLAVWLDDLSRPRINSGALARMIEAGEIVGITTNPSIFSKSISAGSEYEDQPRELALRGTAIGETLRLLTGWDGIASFVQSWDDPIASVEEQLKNAGAEVTPAGAVKPTSGQGASSTAPAAAAPKPTDKGSNG